jgi:hypothetical protein
MEASPMGEGAGPEGGEEAAERLKKLEKPPPFAPKKPALQQPSMHAAFGACLEF